MKKIRKYCFFVVLLLSTIMVYAKTPVAKDLIVRETSGDVFVEPPLVDGDVMTPIVGFGDGGATISYQFRLQFDTYLYSIDSITDNNKNQSLKNDYSFKGDKVFMTMHYDHTVHDVRLQNYQINVRLKANKMVNPPTFPGKLWFIIILYVLLIVFLILSSNARKIKLVICLLFLTPILVFAKEINQFQITVDMSRITMGYKVHFDRGKASSGTMPTIVCLPDHECVLPKNKFSVSDYDFAGWATYPDGAAVFSDQQTTYDLNELGEKEVTLYAKWRLRYKVHFDGNGATSGSMSDITCHEDLGCNLTSNGFERTGYSFRGWATSPTGNVVYNNESAPTYMTTEKNITLYAVWKKIYTVHFNGKGATSGSMSDITCIQDVACQLPTNSFERTGASFTGWATTSTGSVVYSNGSSITTSTEINEMTLYAKWAVSVNFSYTGSYATYTTPTTGSYILEVWGAQGGSYNSSYPGGKGGYSRGTINLTSGETLYIYVGGQPTSYNTSYSSNNVSPGGFNGGGTGRTYSYSGTTTYTTGGGGGTDIRIGQDSLYARVIVAGGGSGSSNISSGYAGGGTSGAGYSSSYYGTQTTAGTNGSFGKGADSTCSSNYKYGPAGAGGGWYGGGRVNSSTDSSSYYAYSVGGGSGYVYTSSTASNYPSGCLLNSSYYLTDATTIKGNTSFPSPSGGNETGHAGNGYARISSIE